MSEPPRDPEPAAPREPLREEEASSPADADATQHLGRAAPGPPVSPPALPVEAVPTLIPAPELPLPPLPAPPLSPPSRASETEPAAEVLRIPAEDTPRAPVAEAPQAPAVEVLHVPAEDAAPAPTAEASQAAVAAAPKAPAAETPHAPPAVPGRAQAARPSPLTFFVSLAAGLILLLALISWWSRGGKVPSKVPSASRTVAPEAGAVAPEVRVLAVVRDLPGELAILSDGHVRGLDAVAEAEQRRVARAVTAGELLPFTDVVALRGSAELLPADAPLRPLSPVATRVTDERPLLRWSAATEPGVYVVTVADASGQVLVSSPPLGTTEWQPPRALPKRRALAWFVDTRPRARGAEAQRSALARFSVLGDDEVAWLQREIQAGGRSLLLTAVLDAEVGAFDEARVALDELIAANPASAELARLRERLRPASAP
jgi:hypothetical protein